jgi:hypothetical protein
MPVEISKGEAGGGRSIDIRNHPRQQRMNVFSGPIAERNLKTLIRLKRFKYAQLGFDEHQQGMRYASA